jgi:hypothetical protein
MLNPKPVLNPIVIYSSKMLQIQLARQSQFSTLANPTSQLVGATTANEEAHEKE